MAAVAGGAGVPTAGLFGVGTAGTSGDRPQAELHSASVGGAYRASGDNHFICRSGEWETESKMK